MEGKRLPLPREIVPQQRDRFALREFRLLDISKDRYVRYTYAVLVGVQTGVHTYGCT